MKESERTSQNTGIKTKWCITPSNKKIKRLNKDVMINTLKKNKSKFIDLQMKNEDNTFQIKEDLSPSPINESVNEFKHKNVKKRRNMYEPTKTPKCLLDQEQVTSTDSSKTGSTHDKKPIKNKKKMFDSFGEEYKPGMLSDSIQKKKYGCVIIPWDPSFGLDRTYKVPDIKNEGLPKLKINPLFDLSKRQNISSTPSADKNQHSIFVGNLPSDIRVFEIKKLFKKCGMIHHIKIKDRNKNVKSPSKFAHENQRHKHALITFKQEESCEKALKMNGHVYKDCHLRVNKASESTKHEESEKTIFVGNLAFLAEDEDLWKHFESCGEIQEVRIVRDERSGKGRGYGYITFKEEEAVEKALELDGLSIFKRNIRVRRNKTGTPTYTFDERKKGNVELSDSIANSDRNDDDEKKISEDIPSKSEHKKKHKRKKRNNDDEKRISEDMPSKSEDKKEHKRKKRNNDDEKRTSEDIPSKSEDKKEHKRKKRQNIITNEINDEANESIQIQEKINETMNEDNFIKKLKKKPKIIKSVEYHNS